MGIISVVSALLSWATYAVLFCPAALVTGIIAVVKGDKLGWWGLGIVGTGIVMMILNVLAQIG
jgi:hypothetical protein